MSLQVRHLPYRVADGPTNMAADEVMLESAIAGVATLRLYGWEPATLSLGYFQKHEERLADPRMAAMAWVRRATGGGAIVHDRDITYALALPPAVVHELSPAKWHERIHQALAAALKQHQVAARVVTGQRAPQADLKFLCFAVPQPGDVVLEGSKVIGGAQRLRSGALLQHGSMQVPDADRFRDRLAERLAEALGWELNPGDWTPAELLRIRELASEKYGQRAWNEKR